MLQTNSTRTASVPPGNRDGDVAWHSSRIFDDLVADAIAPWLQIMVPELEYFLRNPGQRVLPALFLLADGAAPVGAQGIGKAIDQHLRQSVSHRALDDG